MSFKYPTVFVILILIISCKPTVKKNQVITKPWINLNEITIAQLQDGYANGDFTIADVVQNYLDRIDSLDSHGPELHSVIQLNPDALLIAQQLDKELQEGKSRGPMHGIPVLLKDNIDTHDQMSTTAGSRALQGSKPLQDSYVAKKLREAGAVILGKANLSEWANFRGDMSSSGWSGMGGQTKNPYILDRNPCGSSSGSGVAVSANLTTIAIGTETNGSIVCPSTANGIVGIKPTVGLVSRLGVIPISFFTQDTPGPMARTVTDAAICLSVLTGIDSADTKTLASKAHIQKDYTHFLKTSGLKGKRIGIFKQPLGRNYKVDTLFNKAVDFLKNQGAQIVEIEKINDTHVGQLSFDIMLFEYKDGLNNYFKSLGPDAPIKNLEELIAFNKKDTVEMAFYKQEYLEMAQQKEGLDSDVYKKTLSEMLKGARENGIDKVMNINTLDAIIAPTGSPAWKTDHVNGDFYNVSSSSPAAWAGYPNITVPMGFVDGLPVGISFFGRAWSESVLLEIAYAYEQGTKHRKAPKFLEK